MEWFHHLVHHLLWHTNLYCERHDFSFWAEPVNAVTNAGFLLVALWLWPLYRQHIAKGPHALRVRILLWLIVWIGLGSFAFHTLATRWAMILDLAPIALFIFAYLRILLFHLFNMSRRWVVLVCILFVFLSFISSIYVPQELANGSGGYLGALLIFSSVVISVYQHRMPRADDMLIACLLFWISLFLRTMDQAWCDSFPLGTHFLWHLTNAVVLALMMRFLIFNLVRKG